MKLNNVSVELEVVLKNFKYNRDVIRDRLKNAFELVEVVEITEKK